MEIDYEDIISIEIDEGVQVELKDSTSFKINHLPSISSKHSSFKSTRIGDKGSDNNREVYKRDHYSDFNVCIPSLLDKGSGEKSKSPLLSH